MLVFEKFEKELPSPPNSCVLFFPPNCNVLEEFSLFHEAEVCLGYYPHYVMGLIGEITSHNKKIFFSGTAIATFILQPMFLHYCVIAAERSNRKRHTKCDLENEMNYYVQIP